MASVHSPTSGDESSPPPSTEAEGAHPSMAAMHPAVAYPNLPSMHMYTLPTSMTAPPMRSKRRQVKNACTNCQKACKKCDDARPCLRCVKYGVAEECIDSQRKERRKGLKRGPYKKRDGKGSPPAEQSDEPSQLMPAAASGIPFMAPFGYAPPGMFPPVPHTGLKPGEQPAFFPQFFIPMPAPPPQQEGEGSTYVQPQPHYYPFFAPYAQPYPAYMMPTAGRPGEGPAMQPMAFNGFPPMFTNKPTSTNGSDHDGDGAEEEADAGEGKPEET